MMQPTDRIAAPSRATVEEALVGLNWVAPTGLTDFVRRERVRLLPGRQLAHQVQRVRDRDHRPGCGRGSLSVP